MYFEIIKFHKYCILIKKMSARRRMRAFRDLSHPASLFFSASLRLSNPFHHHHTSMHASRPPRSRKQPQMPLRARNGNPETVSPTDPSLQTKTTAISSGSIPIATSTPVNISSGPVSPPPLTLAGQQQQQQQVQDQQPQTTIKVTSYPAVLKGRSGASPPNPNLVPSGKVPPPVPPRGMGTRGIRACDEHRGITTSASSVTSSRGEADLITRYPLHESSWLLHHPVSNNNTFSSTNTNNTVFTDTSNATTRTTAIATCPANLSAASNLSNASLPAATDHRSFVENMNALHARALTPAHSSYGLFRLSYGQINEVSTTFENIQEYPEDDTTQEWTIEDMDDEEFVSVEKVEDTYVIRTSPNPFRPERGCKRKELYFEKCNKRMNTEESVRKQGDELDSKTDHMLKFTYFLNPASRSDLMNYKMSRKDKKHSETYYEKTKRKQRESESTIGTIGDLSSRSKTENISEKFDNRDRTQKISKQIETPLSEYKIKESKKMSVKKLDKEETSLKLTGTRKESRLLRKIRQKSRKKKRLAPSPYSESQTRNPGSTKISNENIKLNEIRKEISINQSPNKTKGKSISEKSLEKFSDNVSVQTSIWKTAEIESIHSTNSKNSIKTETVIKSKKENKNTQSKTSNLKNDFKISEVVSEQADFKKSFRIFEHRNVTRSNENVPIKSFGTSANSRNDSNTEGTIVGGESKSNVPKPVLSDEEYALYLESQANRKEKSGVLKRNPSFLHDYEKYLKRK